MARKLRLSAMDRVLTITLKRIPVGADRQARSAVIAKRLVVYGGLVLFVSLFVVSITLTPDQRQSDSRNRQTSVPGQAEVLGNSENTFDTPDRSSDAARGAAQIPSWEIWLWSSVPA